MRVSNRRINLDNSNYINVSYTYEGIFFDLYDKNDKHLKTLGFDLFEEILTQ